MVGSGKIIPDRDAQEIGLPARRYLQQDKCAFVILIDDLERGRAPQRQQVYERYRRALDTILAPVGLQKRASVHFLGSMLEAYYFAHADALNVVLGTALVDYSGDVEGIEHPKNELKRMAPGFDERRHGGEIVTHLDVERVLSKPDTCASLRCLFAWCSYAIGEAATDRYRLADGIYGVTTGRQIGQLSTS
jgi:phytoene dehydrogenase-like protein